MRAPPGVTVSARSSSAVGWRSRRRSYRRRGDGSVAVTDSQSGVVGPAGPTPATDRAVVDRQVLVADRHRDVTVTSAGRRRSAASRKRPVGELVDRPADARRSTSAGRPCAGSRVRQAGDPQHVHRVAALEVAVQRGEGRQADAGARPGAGPRQPPSVPIPVTDRQPAARSPWPPRRARRRTTCGDAGPAPTPSTVRPVATSSSAYSTAGAAKAGHGSIAQSIDAGTEYRHSSGRATRAGAWHTAMRMSTMIA